MLILRVTGNISQKSTGVSNVTEYRELIMHTHVCAIRCDVIHACVRVCHQHFSCAKLWKILIEVIGKSMSYPLCNSLIVPFWK